MFFIDFERIPELDTIRKFGAFATVTKDTDYKNEIDRIIPNRSHFTIHDFQELTKLLGQIFIKDGYDLDSNECCDFDLDKKFSELQNFNVIQYFKKELEKEIQSHKDLKMIFGALEDDNSLQTEFHIARLEIDALKVMFEEERVRIERKCELIIVRECSLRCETERECEELKKKSVNLEVQISSLQKEKRKSEENEKTLSSQKDSYENEKNALKVKLTRTEEIKDKFQSELKASQQENVEKETKLRSQNLTIECLEEKKSNLVSQLKEQIFCLKIEKEKGEKLESALEGTQRDLCFEKERSENKTNDLQNKLRDYDKLLKTLSTEYSFQKESMKKYRQENEIKEMSKPQSVNYAQQTDFDESTTRLLASSWNKNAFNRMFNGRTQMSVIFGIFTFFAVPLILFWFGFLW